MNTWNIKVNNKNYKNCTSLYLATEIIGQNFWWLNFLDGSELVVHVSDTLVVSKEFMQINIRQKNMPEPDDLYYTVQVGWKKYKVSNHIFENDICELRLFDGRIVYFPLTTPIKCIGRIKTIQKRLSREAGREIELDLSGRAVDAMTKEPYISPAMKKMQEEAAKKGKKDDQ